jgi:CDP-diacylglycerol--serine O-phosphatidyltransferase
VNYLANLLTGLSLAFGFASIIFSLHYHFTFAAWAIIFSVVLDGMDGPIARINPVPSDFGKQLDSLVDVISFGIAPAILGYIFVCRDYNIWALSALFVYLLSSVFRLAKYNITPKEELVTYFYGLPTTASGGIISSFILIYRKYIHMPPETIFFSLILVLSFLMVSKVKYLNIKGLKRILGVKGLIFIGVLALPGFFFIPQITIFSFFAVYLLLSPFFARNA